MQTLNRLMKVAWTTEDIENEVTVMPQHLETSYKNNCTECKTHTSKGEWWWYPELETMHKKMWKNIRNARRNQAHVSSPELTS